MDRTPRVAIVYPAGRGSEPPTAGYNRFHNVAEALQGRGVAVQPVAYRDEMADHVQRQLRGVDAALVWLNPIHDGRDRSILDALLRDVAAHGVFVSAHPDVILKMGTKEVLFTTQEMGWSGGDIHLYRSAAELHSQLPARLAVGAVRVLKQNRGNGGDGIWRVERAERPGPPDRSGTRGDLTLRVLHALRGSQEQEMPLHAFVTRCEAYFERGGQMIDQPFQSPLPGGMVRCYLTHDEVVGFGHQYVTALTRPEGGLEAPPPSPRLYYPQTKAEFQPLRARMEDEWIPQLQGLLEIPRASLPVLWDADFLYGPKEGAGDDSFRLCEINVSSVHPFPDSAVPRVVEATIQRIRALA